MTVDAADIQAVVPAPEKKLGAVLVAGSQGGERKHGCEQRKLSSDDLSLDFWGRGTDVDLRQCASRTLQQPLQALASLTSYCLR